MGFDLEELIAIVELLDKADFTEFRFEKGDLRIAVSRGPARLEPLPAISPAAAATPAVVAGRVSPTVAGPAPAATSPLYPLTQGDVIVKAPLLGAFYRSPKPGAPPFVNIGDEVETDAIVCIIEVMKLMNSVAAGSAGSVVAIHATDGQLVEFDQPLFVIRPHE